MNFTAQDVKALREKTGCGMMDCKKALVETDGDMDKAVDILREQGLAKAAKKASRIAAEGVAFATTSDDNKIGVVVEVNAETDFVAKNADFMSFVETVAKTIMKESPADVDALMTCKACCTEMTVDELLTEKIQVIGENIKIRRFVRYEGNCVSYVHAGGKIGVLVEAQCDNNSDAIKEAMNNVAMQIAAMNPQYVSRDEISADTLAKEKEIVVDSSLADPASLPKPILNGVITEAIESGKWSDEDKAAYEEQKNNKFLFNFLSDEGVQVLRDIAAAHKAEYLENKIFAGLVEGRFAKHLKEICLVDQTYVKAEDKENVKQYVEKVAKETGANFAIKSFIRFETGEGLEKKNEDFAAEVAAQMGQ